MIRAMEFADVDAVATMAAAMYSESNVYPVVDRDIIRDNVVVDFTRKNIATWVYEDDGAVVGYCRAAAAPLYMDSSRKRVYDFAVFVIPNKRGNGYGEQLVRHAVDALRSMNVFDILWFDGLGTAGVYAANVMERVGFTKETDVYRKAL